MTKFASRIQFLPPEPPDRSAGSQPPAQDFWKDGIDMPILGAKLRRRRWRIFRTGILCALLAGAAMALHAQLRTSTFTAATDILIANTSLQMSGPEAVVTQVMVDVSLLESEIELLKSSRVLEKAIEQIGPAAIEALLTKQENALRFVPPFLAQAVQGLLPSTSIGTPLPVTDPNPRQTIVAALRAAITVKRLGSSTILSVRATAATPDGAARLANTVARAFVNEQDQNNGLITTSASLRERIKVLGASARIINDAVPPRFKDGPGGTLLALAGTAAGGMLGLMIGGLGVCLDTRIRHRQQLARLTPAEFLGTVPHLRRRARVMSHPVLARMRLAALEGLERTPRVIGITSCGEGAGKTTFAEGLARLIAAEGKMVLLIDSSAGNPEMSMHFAPHCTQGVRQVLRGEADVAGVLDRNIADCLDFLPLGEKRGENEAVWSDFSRVVKGNPVAHAWVIVDMAPLQPGTMVRSAGAALDGVFLVVADGQTPEKSLQDCLAAMGPVRDKLLGVVLNSPSRATSWRKNAIPRHGPAAVPASAASSGLLSGESAQHARTRVA